MSAVVIFTEEDVYAASGGTGILPVLGVRVTRPSRTHVATWVVSRRSLAMPRLLITPHLHDQQIGQLLLARQHWQNASATTWVATSGTPRMQSLAGALFMRTARCAPVGFA